ncbi:MAG: hypothetical protein WKF82_12445 [Nocardioidaceae bacterium]
MTSAATAATSGPRVPRRAAPRHRTAWAMTLKRINTSSRAPLHLDGQPVPGAMTLLSGGLPKPALPRWAAKAAAEFVAQNLEVLNQLPDRESVIATVKQSPWTQRDWAAVRGTRRPQARRGLDPRPRG